MSKYVKNLMTDQLKRELDGVGDALVVSIEGIDAISNCELRRKLRQKNIHLRVVKNSLARRATEGTVLAPAFADLSGPAAVVWGGEDIVSLAKEIVGLSTQKQYEKLTPRGGAMDGQPLSSEEVKDVSKWPSRTEQLSILVGQILSAGGNLASQIGAPAGLLASQVKKKSEGGEEAASEEAAPTEPAAG
jgi:large subunit ribosomal protein L10